MNSNYSQQCIDILELLNKKKNVVLLGAPATGKSKLLNEVSRAFLDIDLYTKLERPIHKMNSVIPIPQNKHISNSNDNYPGLGRGKRKVFRTTFHQNSKYRDFISGIVPVIGKQNEYKVNMGTLYKASEYAKQKDSAALVIIDELNRGAAVEIFGGSIVSIEPDKRLDDDNNELPNTQKFELLNCDGDIIEYAFPSNLFILAAMNQADSSVAPLDIAFLRRWCSYRLQPNIQTLFDFFGIEDNTIKDKPICVEDVYNVAILAWNKINERIKAGRGSDYQIGQGVFFSNINKKSTDIKGALQDILEVWTYIFSHVEECFWGDTVALAFVLNIRESNTSHPYQLHTVLFAEDQKDVISVPKLTVDSIYQLYLSIIGEEIDE